MTDKQRKLLQSFDIDPDKYQEIVFSIFDAKDNLYEEIIYDKIANTIIDLITQNDWIDIGHGIKEEKRIFPDVEQEAKETSNDPEKELKPVGDVMVPSKENPLPKDEFIQVTLKDGSTYKGKQITGGFKDLDGLWVLSDTALGDEVKSFRKLSKE